MPDLEKQTLEKLRSGVELAPDERFALEAIIIPDKRPAIDIIEGDYQTSHQLWLHLNEADAKETLKARFSGIGRIELPGHPTLPYGGTGFVVGPGLIMTNRHVAEIFTRGLGTQGLRFIDGLGAGIDFSRERRDLEAEVLPVLEVVMIHPYWDMALLRVDNLPAHHRVLELSAAEHEDLVGREVAVVGYPAFDPRNPSDVQNEVFGGVYGIKRLQPGHLLGARGLDWYRHRIDAATHDSSTLGGNSGSCVLDIASGEVVGLHFGGRYTDTNFCVPAGQLARDERVVAAGVRFSSEPEPGQTPWDSVWLNLAHTAAPANAAPATIIRGNLSMNEHEAGSVRFTIPLEVTVRLGASTTASVALGTDTVSMERNVEPFHETNYGNRQGYDPEFLDVSVPLPEPRNPDQLVSMANGDTVIPYHHFSLVMHAQRRLALYTAANVDASEESKTPGNEEDKAYTRRGLSGLGESDREKWFGDPRIRANEQLPDKFFTRDRASFDKGHLVRRDDVAFGETYEEMRGANGDTYHVTNCSPQVLGFNRSSRGEDNWGDLENLVLKEAESECLAVFCGPVLKDDDPIFTGVDTEGTVAVKIPRRFWKLIVAEHEGALQTFGFVLEQDLSDVEMEMTVPQRWEQFMKPVSEIEDLAQLDFDQAIREGDQAGTPGGERVASAMESGPDST
ncbi:MAG: hypothetical protein GWM87_02530 [Xanthomonadales bacterium]|nr:hypothetical protein [Xanthomonadales bacterium]NIX11937.1 hypothetical protein [Xanthomonadales bacterium]